jgi:hypothetical protein
MMIMMMIAFSLRMRTATLHSTTQTSSDYCCKVQYSTVNYSTAALLFSLVYVARVVAIPCIHPVE